MTRVGVRELKQNASAVLARVKAGEAVEVTERGRPVALIVPLPEDDPLERLIAEGKARRGEGSLDDLPPPLKPRKNQPPLSRVLEEMRDDER
jgi:prevent-host-death family protein